MKKRFKVLIAAMCVLALAVTPAFAAWGDTSSGEMTATNQDVRNLTNVGKKIESFLLDGKYKYQSLGTDSGKTTLTVSRSNLQNIVKNTLLPQWSGIAASVFRDQAGQLVDLYGYYPNGGNMSQVGFDAYFNVSQSGKDFQSETWSCNNLSDKLAQTYATHAGDPGWDQFTVSGVRQISSLKDARSMVGQALYDCQGHKGLEAHEFLDVDENGNTRLDPLDSDTATTGFVNLVTSVNCKGASSDFDYVSFGIVFYDFEMVPVAANGLSYVHGGFKVAEDNKGSNESVITNGQQQDIMHSAVLGDSVTETTSTSISALASFKMSQNIGASVGWKESQSGSDTEFGDEGGSASTSGWSEETSLGLNWGAAWELAGAAGAEVGHSQSKEVSKAVETTIALPAHTAATINHTMSTTTYTQSYQQPVILNYKVALFAVSGDYYTGGDGGINSSIYDKQSLVILFDTKDDATPSYGCAATDDLYSRVITNRQVASYDVADGRTYDTHSTASGFNKSDNINWDSVMDVASRYYGANVAEVAKTNHFYETPGSLSVDKDKTTSEVKSIYPLYGLASVNTPKTNYVLHSGDTLDRAALTVEGYNKFGVPFYGFDSKWGEWNRCDENGTIINGGYLLDEDPAYITGQQTIAPKPGTEGGTIYLTWRIEDETAKPMTGESPQGQNLAASNIASPVVKIQVVNSKLDNPSVTAGGSYIGSYNKPVNLNNVLTYEVTDSTDVIVETQVKWQSREPSSAGIYVNADSGNVTFLKPGTYNVRPYVINNEGKPVYSAWIPITATEHDMTYFGPQAPTCTNDGCTEHYWCSDCKKYFSDAEGTIELAAEDVIIEATGHAWGEWTTTKQVSGDTPGEQRRVCKNDASHVETRALYAVQFNMNGHGTAPETQTVAAGASVSVPGEPTEAGYTFEGWFTNESCTEPYDFGSTVKNNLTLYAKWSVAKYTIAAMAVGDVYTDEAGEQRVYSTRNGELNVEGGISVTEEGFTYSYKEVESGATVTLTAKPAEGYGVKAIEATPVNADSSMGESFVPDKTGATTYSITMPAADVAVGASFGQVTVSYDGNAPANATVSNVPEAQTIPYGTTPAKPPTDPTATGASGAEYAFGGWCTDPACTKPFLFVSAVTEDTTLYAKWVQTTAARYTVSYTLFDVPGSDPASYSEAYVVEGGSVAYDPTPDLYAIADRDLLKGYELKKDAKSGSCWFTDADCTHAFDFSTPIEANTQLFASIVPRKFTVTYFNVSEQLGTQVVDYNTAIGTVSGFEQPTKAGYALGWVADNGAPWDVATAPVTGDMKLYANWSIGRYTLTFDANGHGKAPAAITADYNTTVAEPAAPETDGYTFDGWYKESTCENPWNFSTDKVTQDTTLYAKWTANGYTVTFDNQGHGTAPAAQRIAYDNTAAVPTAPTATGYAFGGWFREPACTNKWTFSEDKVTQDTTLYAKWTANTHKVNIATPIGQGTVTSSATSADYDSTVTLTVTPGKDSNGDYGLQTITVTPAGGTPFTPTKTASGTYTVTMPDADVTVNTTFSQITITYTPNAPETGGKVANNPGTRHYAYGSVPAEPPAPTFSGGSQEWVFGGWYTASDLMTPYLFSFPETNNQTLYGEWVKASEQRTVTYTIFDVPGSDPASYSSDDIVAKGDRAYDPTAQTKNYITTLAGISEYKYYEGYELYAVDGKCWFTDEACTTPYDFSTQVTQDIQLYAKLMPKSYTVTYLAEKGAAEALTTATFDYGTAIGNSAPKPTKEGHALSSWKKAIDDSAWDMSTPVTSDLILYADWMAATSTVTFDANGHGTAPAAQTVTYPGTVKKPATDPAEAGYTFGGWFTDPDCTAAYDFGTAVASDMRLYAKWTQNVCNVTFDTNGAGAGPATQTVEYGGKATEPADAPTLTGRTFGGWFTEAGCTNAYDFDTPVTKDTTLYAKWTVNEYTVTFDANGHGTAPAAQTVKHGEKATEPTALAADGFIFGGWFTDAACTAAYDFAAPVEADLKLFAKWTPAASTVTFDANGHGTAPAAQTVKQGEKAAKPADLAADGFAFGGWFTDKDCTTAYDFDAAVTGNLTLYAKWTAKQDISDAQVTLSQTSFVYDYTAKEPTVTVKLGDKELSGGDYTVAYEYNVEVGLAAVIVTGKGDYSGQALAAFEITSPAHAARTYMADLDANAWYMSRESGVGAFQGTDTLFLDHVIAKGLMSGYKDAKGNVTGFGPNDELERCQAAVIIYRMANPDSTDTTDAAAIAATRNTSGLADVPDGEYFTAAVNWAVENGVITGYKDANGTVVGFGPHESITREQLATIIGRFMDPQGTAGKDVSMYKDASSISDWAAGGVAYCNSKGIMTGVGDSGNFDPQGKTQRCAMAKVIAVTDRPFNAEVNTQASAAPATTEMPPASTGGLLPGAAAL